MTIKGQSVEQSWKPKGWLSIVFGLVIQPFVFLYVNKAKWFWFYSALVFLFAFIDLNNQAGVDNSAWYKNIPLSWLPTLICPVHAYWLSRYYDSTQKRKWYASGWVTIGCFIGFLAIVFASRTFVYDLFSIPASSMSPTLKRGDHVLVSKLGFGNYRFLGQQVIKSPRVAEVHRGDIIVFQYPEKPQIDYVKRVIGLPGDTVIYQDKQLSVKRFCGMNAPRCGELESAKLSAEPKQSASDTRFEYYRESLFERSYDIQLDPSRKDMNAFYFFQPKQERGEWVVPEGHYFVLGDNRDNSRDSRYWGFVPDDHLVGKVVFVW